MRELEIVLVASTAAILMSAVSGRAGSVFAALLALAALATLIAHHVIDGHRWQMWPAYAVAVWLILATLVMPAIRPGLWLGFGGLAALVLTTLAAVFLPVYRFPKPTGPHPIGTTIIHLIDARRSETHVEKPGPHRELMVQLWYPASQSGPLQPFQLRSEVNFRRSRHALVKTHASLNAPLTDGAKYPLLVYSPAWTGRRNQNTAQAEELASHGFIVAGIDHPYGSEWTIFPDGRRVATVLGSPYSFSSDQALQSSLVNAESELQIRVADARFVIDELSRLNDSDASGLLAGHVDMQRIGAFGHSFGGTVASELARFDDRVHAVINLDGLLHGTAAQSGVDCAFMYMSAEFPRVPTPEQLASATGRRLRRLTFLDEQSRSIRGSLAQHGGYFLTIRGTYHMNFCDSPLGTPLRKVTEAGPADPNRVLRVINDYALAFFRHSLQGHEERLLDGPSTNHADVDFESWTAP